MGRQGLYMEDDMKKATQTKNFVVQRYVYKGYGAYDGWRDFSWESDLAKVDRELMEQFKDNTQDEELAEKVILALTKARPGEKFRLAFRTVTVEDEYMLEMGPRRPFSLDDLRKLAENPISHDGVRTTNENAPAIREAGLDSAHFGALSTSLVKFALDNLNNPPDEWLLVHPECYKRGNYEPWDHRRTWWNLAQKAYIKFDTWGVGDEQIGYFVRHNYKDHTTEKYLTFQDAAQRRNRSEDFLPLNEAKNTFPNNVREL